MVHYDIYKGENRMAAQNTNGIQNRNKPSYKEQSRIKPVNRNTLQGKPVKESILYLLPIMFVVAILPLIVKLYQYSANFSQFNWFSIDDISFDFFLYYKQLFLIIDAIIICVFLFYKYMTDRKNIIFPKIFIPLAIYGLLALLSSVISKYRSYSFTGTFDQFESVFALLSYCILAYYSFLIIRTERDLKYIIFALLIGAFLMSLLGLSQVTGHDFYNTDTGWSLISNSTYANNKADFPITAGLNRVYLSLFNPNYVGVYVSLIFPIMLFMTIFTKKILPKLAFLVTTIGLLVCLYGSKSTTGFISIIITVLLSLILLWRYIIKYYYVSLPIMIITILGLFFINSYTGNYIGNHIDKLDNIQKWTPLLTEVQTNDDNLLIQYGGNTLKVEFAVLDGDICQFTFKDQTDNDVYYTMDVINGPVTITDERFPGFVFTPMVDSDGSVIFKAVFDDKTWYFTNQYSDNTFYYINLFGKKDKIIRAPSSVFTGHETFASGRGYIWSRTIPLLKNKIILGSGADTFSLVFPHNDYVNSKIYGYEGLIMSKPHNLYLQVGVQTGVLSLLAILVFYGLYFISSIKIYFKYKFDHYFIIAGAAIFVSTIGYIVSGITNDSTITTAPIFWVLIGIGIAVNKSIITEKQNHNDV
jgi:hypothetical protein